MLEDLRIDRTHVEGETAATAREAESANLDSGKCSACAKNNREEARFCAECGATFLSEDEIAELEAQS